jgi:iron complex outermembrane recepter protein
MSRSLRILGMISPYAENPARDTNLLDGAITASDSRRPPTVRFRNVQIPANNPARARPPCAIAAPNRGAHNPTLTPIALAVFAVLHGAPVHAGETLPVVITPITSATASTTSAASTTGDATVANSTVVASNTTIATGADGTDSAVADGGHLQTVMVTATRREANAQDLPVSITAIAGDQLQQAGIEDMASLARSMAGVNFTDKGPFGGVNGSTLIIRGLNSEQTAGQLALASPVVPPVATYVDDTPLFVNLRLQDVERVEVLRGPQGTLYGSGSLGGTVRYVLNPPDLSAFDARAEIGASDTRHTHAPNEEASGILNVPFGSTFAVRLNASWAYDAGFINQPNLYKLDGFGAPVPAQPGNLWSPPVTYSQDGTNYYDYRTARVATLWKPTDAFHAELSYYYQLETAHGFPYAATQPAAYNQWISPATQPAGTYTNPPLATQLYNAPVPPGVDRLSNADSSLEGANDRVDLTALTLEYDLGFATLTSTSSYAHHLNHSSSDLTALYTNFFFFQSLYGQNPRSFVQGRDVFDDRPWSEELRIASKNGGAIDWVFGLFYRDEKTNIQEHEFYPGYWDFYSACAPVYGQSVGDGTTPSYCGVGETAYAPGPLTYVDGIPIVKDQAYIGDFETRFKDLAAFGEMTLHVTHAWSVTGGARAFKQTVTQAQQTGLLFDAGPYFGATPPLANSSLSDTWQRALWKVNTAYQLDKNNLIYATWSQGFRRGGVNALPPVEFPGQPNEYDTPPALFHLKPDKADNYEVGIKGTIAGRLRYSADVYDIEWHNIQEGVQLTPLVLPASLNIGDAYSRGAEVELYAVLTRHWNAQLDYTYDRTAITSLNPLFALPNVSAPPPPIGTPLPGTPKNSAALDLEYGNLPLAGGDLTFDVSAHYQSSLLPALSATIPTVAGYTMLDTRVTFTRIHWLASLYVTNLTDNLGIQSYSDPALYGNRWQAIVSQPRTIGFTFTWSYSEL